MSSAAKANPVVLGVGDADAGGADVDGRTGVIDGETVASTGDAAGPGLTMVDPQAATSRAAATTNETWTRRGARRNGKSTPSDTERMTEPSIEREDSRIIGQALIAMVRVTITTVTVGTGKLTS